MMTPEDFREQYASEHGYEEWAIMHMEVKDVDEIEDDVMKAYALHVMEVFERDIDAYDESNLKPFFDEIKKKLK